MPQLRQIERFHAELERVVFVNQEILKDAVIPLLHPGAPECAAWGLG